MEADGGGFGSLPAQSIPISVRNGHHSRETHQAFQTMILEGASLYLGDLTKEELVGLLSLLCTCQHCKVHDILQLPDFSTPSRRDENEHRWTWMIDRFRGR